MSAPTTGSRRWNPDDLSLRIKVLVLVLLPVLALGAAWFTTVQTVQAPDARSLLVQGARQAAATFASTVSEEVRASLNPERLRINLERRLEALVTSDLLTLEFAAITDADGRVLYVRDRAFNAGGGRWADAFPQTLALIARSGNGEGQGTPRRVDGREIIPVSVGAAPLGVVFGLNTAAVESRVRGATLVASAALVITLLIAGVAAAAYAAHLVARIARLARTAEQVSLGVTDAPLSSDAGDEIGTLARALERLRTSVEILSAGRGKVRS